MERDTVANRVKKLEFEERRALKTLNQTIRAHEVADQIKKRKEDDANNKAQWLYQKQQELNRCREKNMERREETKNNIRRQRQSVVMQNIMARDRQLNELQ